MKENPILPEELKSYNETAWGNLNNRYRNQLISIAERIAPGHGEDIASATILHAYEAIHTFQESGNLISWLKASAANRARDVLRSGHMRFNAGYLAGEQEIEYSRDGTSKDRYIISANNIPGTPSAEDTYFNDSEKEILTIIASLPTHQQQVIFLDAHGFSMKEIANKLKRPQGTIQSQLFRGRARIKLFIEQQKEELNAISPPPQE